MRNKVVRYVIGIAVLLTVAYNLVYFKSLSEVKAASATNEFDASSYAQTYWNNSIVPAIPTAVGLSELLTQLKQDPEKVFQQYSHALGIGNIRYFMIKGEGKVTTVNENDVSILIAGDTAQFSVRLATEFVYGNAVRDAVGGIDLTEFTNTANLNAVSAEINKKIRKEVVPPFKSTVKEGMTVQFAGAIELNRKYPDLTDIEVMPVSITIKQ